MGGIPLVVVGMRSDSQNINEAAEVQSPVIEMHLRQACICYGAAVIYTSVQEEYKNVKLLYTYLMHRLYNYDFANEAIMNSRDELFIPCGFDAEAKLDKKVMEKSFESVVVPPVQASADADQNVEAYESMDRFLLRAQGHLQKLGGGAVARVSSTPDKPDVSKFAPAGADGPPKDNAALTSFFQNLLTKGGTPIPPGGAAPAPAAAPAAAANGPP